MINFELFIKNFGIINESNIEISKLNVVTGKNATGKSTSSKLLYSFLASISRDGQEFINNKIQTQLINLLRILSDAFQTDKFFNFAKALNENSNFEDIIHIFNESFMYFKNSDLSKKEVFLDRFNQIQELIDNAYNLDEILLSILNLEFNGQMNLSKSQINFTGDNINFNIHTDDKIYITLNSDFLNIYKDVEVIYIESPLILDFMDYNFSVYDNYYHQFQLVKKLQSKRNILDINKNNEFIEEFNQLLGGEFLWDDLNSKFVFKKDANEFSLKNTAMGIKQFGLLQILLKNNKLKEGCFLILDEPEVHIHPEWQVKLAELIVLLVKKLNILVYINSHSPAFIESIEAYSLKYSLKDDTNFYLTIEDDNKFNIVNIKRNELYKIYDNLGDPYDIVDKVKADNIKNGLLDV